MQVACGTEQIMDLKVILHLSSYTTSMRYRKFLLDIRCAHAHAHTDTTLTRDGREHTRSDRTEAARTGRGCRVPVTGRLNETEPCPVGTRVT